MPVMAVARPKTRETTNRQTGSDDATLVKRLLAGDEAEPSSSGQVSWTFETVDGTNLQSFRVTIRSQHAWLPITTTVTSAITPSNQPPARISTQGQYRVDPIPWTG